MLDGRYRLERRLARGAQALTYEALRIEDRVRVVAKELPLHGMADWRVLERFRREAAVLRQLDHPGIPRLIEECESGEGKAKAMWLIQQWVPGHSLESELEHHRYDESEVVEVIRHVADILAYLHERRPPVVHRDIKPANIMRRTEDRGLSLVDFGAVRDSLVDPVAGGVTVSGTFGYMAPEQLQGDAVPASDVYALGATALRLLTREEPGRHIGFDGRLKTDRLQVLTANTLGLLEQMMAPDPAARPRDGTALRQALERAPKTPAALGRSVPEDRTELTAPERGTLEIPALNAVLRILFSGGLAMTIAGFAFGFSAKMGTLGIVLMIFSRSAARPWPPSRPRHRYSTYRRNRRRRRRKR